MSNKQFPDWTDALLGKAGASGLPVDDFTFSTGNNGMLDGFQFDTPYGEGVEESGRLPQTKGLSGLPDGIVTVASPDEDIVLEDTENGLNFEAMLSEEEGGLPEDASVLDFLWLDPTQEQDPERLPDGPETLDSVSQLETAWGERTDGIRLTPDNRDREAEAYKESLKEPLHSGLPGTKTAEDISDAVRKALRRAHFGHSLDAIKRELVATLGHAAIHTRKAVQKIEGEYGLLGNVYIRASAFPGINRGQWVKELRRAASNAIYVITDNESVANQLGIERLASVDQIPWGDVMAYYLPRLKASGYKIASGDPQTVLKKAFLAGPQVAESVPVPKPVVKPVIASQAEAKAALAAPKPESIKVKTGEDVARDKKMRLALIRLAQWVKAGQLSQKDAQNIREFSEIGTVRPEELLKAATDLMTATGNSPVYDGIGAHLPEGAQMAREAALESLIAKQDEFEKGQRAKVAKRLGEVVSAGLLTEAEAGRIRTMCASKTAAEALRVIAVAVEHAQHLRSQEVILAAEEAKEYEGPGTVVMEAHLEPGSSSAPVDPQEAAILRVAQRTSIKAGEFRGLLKYARQQMSEGMAGADLDALLSARFNGPLLKAADSLLKATREAHEGLSGHLYVDAAAYASSSGTTGCERGALKHRANSLKFVLSFDRCAECVYANAVGVCSQYNKRLADQPPVEDPKEYQKEVLRQADAPDAENTAAMFNPKEYDLTAGALEDIPIDPDLPAQTLGEVLFGGLDLTALDHQQR